jgi:hypothetical protein
MYLRRKRRFKGIAIGVFLIAAPASADIGPITLSCTATDQQSGQILRFNLDVDLAAATVINSSNPNTFRATITDAYVFFAGNQRLDRRTGDLAGRLQSGLYGNYATCQRVQGKVL